MRLQETGTLDTRPLKVVPSGQPNTVLKYLISIHHIIANIKVLESNYWSSKSISAEN